MFTSDHTRRQSIPVFSKCSPGICYLGRQIKLQGQTYVSSFPLGPSPSNDNLEVLRGFNEFRNVAFFK